MENPFKDFGRVTGVLRLCHIHSEMYLLYLCLVQMMYIRYISFIFIKSSYVRNINRIV